MSPLGVQVPWSRLGKEPVVVEFDRLYILAGPRTEQKDKDDSVVGAAPVTEQDRPNGCSEDMGQPIAGQAQPTALFCACCRGLLTAAPLTVLTGAGHLPVRGGCGGGGGQAAAGGSSRG